MEMYRDHHREPVTGRYIGQLISRVVVPTGGVLQEQSDDGQYAKGDAA